MSLEFTLDGRAVSVPDSGAGTSLLEVLRDRLGCRSPKDGCSPQGQCGCCTVWVDAAPRVACVTPVRRVAGRQVTTLDGLAPEVRARWAEAFSALGASQCGFCTPGIIMRLAGLADSREDSLEPAQVERALLAHLCRCTGWRTIIEAGVLGSSRETISSARDWVAAERRARLEGGVDQKVGPSVALGLGGFADDTAPPGCLVAVPDGAGDWAVGETLREARAAAGKTQGRRSPHQLEHPLEVPPGDWALRLRTTWTEPAYLETDASWCVPGGQAASPLENGGAFGGKVSSPAPAAARRLADRYRRPVRVLLSREDVVALGPKRPPLAAGIQDDGTGVMRVARTPGVAALVNQVAPGIAVEEVGVAGPATSASVRGAGWVEAAVLLSAQAAGSPGRLARVAVPWGGWAEASIASDGGIDVRVSCGEVLDEVVLRSYCTGAAHMGLGLVRSEGIAVDTQGEPCDLTIRSFGVLRGVDMPEVRLQLVHEGGPPLNGSDAVMAAVAASAWLEDGLVTEWPTRRVGA